MKRARGQPAHATLAAERQATELAKLGMQHLESERIRESRECFEHALALSPNSEAALHGYGRWRLAVRDPAGAAEVLRSLLARSPKNSSARSDLARALQLLGRIKDSQGQFERAIRADPSNTAARRGLAELHERKGDRQAAIAAIRGALDEKDEWESRLRHAELIGYEGQVEIACNELDLLLDRHSNNPLIRGHALQRKSWILLQQGREPEAYAVLDQAKHALLQAESERYGQDSYQQADIFRSREALHHDLEQTHVQAWAEELAGSCDPQDSPAPSLHVFLIGFPRSGTTIVAKGLSQLPGVETLDETPLLEQVSGLVQATNPAGGLSIEQLNRLTIDQIKSLRRAYFDNAAIRTRSKLSEIALLDKMPLNCLHLPVLSRVFPDARIILVRRDPRDVALSCYEKLGGIQPGERHFLSLERIAALQEHAHKLASRFQAIKDGPIVRLRYEEYVCNPGQGIRSLCASLGLQYNEQEEKHRYFASPTYQEANRPVHTNSIGRWKTAPVQGIHDSEVLREIANSV